MDCSLPGSSVHSISQARKNHLLKNISTVFVQTMGPQPSQADTHLTVNVRLKNQWSSQLSQSSLVTVAEGKQTWWVTLVCNIFFLNWYRSLSFTFQCLWRHRIMSTCNGVGKYKPLMGQNRTNIIMTASLIAQLVKNPPAMRETPVWFLGQEDSLEKG